MRREQQQKLISLAEAEGWSVEKRYVEATRSDKIVILAEGQEFDLMHPGFVHLRLYREYRMQLESEKCFDHMKRFHDLCWPHHVATWNEWAERTFRAHCESFSQLVLAGGASCGKSFNAAKIALIFWLSDPNRNAVIVASTTLESLEGRIWGYVAKFAGEMALKMPIKVLSGKPPKVILSGTKDKLHGMFALAAKEGEAAKIINTWIGRHPERGMLVVLDEATDISPSIIEVIPNLETAPWFQLMAIGNSNNKNDLHGALATPADPKGWASIDPMRDDAWPTLHKDSICLYFNPYKSPAITEKDPEKKRLLGRFLITEEELANKEAEFGRESDSFYRFVLGFWKTNTGDNTIINEAFLSEHLVYKNAEWAGFHALMPVAGLDPAFQVGGSGCLLRLALLGQTANGQMVLDYRGTELLFRINVKVASEQSSEYQMAQEIVRILREFRCPVRHMVIDASGVGRALGELIRLVSNEPEGPLKMFSGSRVNGLKAQKDNPDILVTTPSELWFKFKEFVQRGQIRGLDATTIAQLVNRLVVTKGTRLVLETKDDFRSRMNSIMPSLARSPDEADAAILALHAAVLRLGFACGQTRKIPTDKVDAFWTEKHQAMLVERGSLGLRFGREVKLIPNFSGSVEDIPKPKGWAN